MSDRIAASHPMPPLMSSQRIFELAVASGCRPTWADGEDGWAWHCTCADELHYSDPERSAITEKSARRKRIFDV
jgi:hypothetical protein